MMTRKGWATLARAACAGTRSAAYGQSRYVAAQATSSGTTKAGLSFRRAASTLAMGATFYSIGALYPPDIVSLVFPRPAPPPPVPDSDEGIMKTATIEAQIQTLPDILALRTQKNKYYESRPHIHFPEERRVNSLTAGALRGPGKVAVAPIVFARHDESEIIAFVHVGRGVCGHDGIVHGGLLATLMDESLARAAILNLPNKVGVTAKLEMNYKSPTKADQFICIRTSLVEQKGRKAQVKGHIETMDGRLLVEASALFVEPKHAHLLQSSWMSSALGKPVAKSTESLPGDPTSLTN